MKKLFMFLAVAGLATFGASCSKSDDSKPNEEVKALVLSSDKSTVKVGESVTFTSKVDGKDVAGADIYVGGVKSANPYKFDKEGTFDVVSKKTGYKDSNTVKITVTKEDQPAPKTLVLSADKSTGFVGDSVTFTVKVDGKDETGFDIYVDGTKGTNPHKFDKEGTFKVVAKKANFKDSNEVSIVITKKNTDLALTADKTSVKVGDKVTFTVKNGGNVVADATLKLNGATVTSPWTATAEGTYKFTATKTGFNTSNEVTVVVEKAPAAGVNQIVKNDKDKYDVNMSYYEFSLTNYAAAGQPDQIYPTVANYPGGGYANVYYLNVLNFDGTNVGDNGYVILLVKNPTIKIANNQITDFGTPALPDATNTAYAGGGFNLAGTKYQTQGAADTGTIAVTEFKIVDTTNLTGTTKYNFELKFGTDVLKLKYEGDMFVEEYVEKAARSASRNANRLGVKSSTKSLKNIKTINSIR